MVKRVTRLTDSQAAQMPTWRDKWIGIGLSTEPMQHGDKWEVDQAIRAMYRKTNLPEPKSILFLPSPLSLRIAAGIAAGAIYVLRGNLHGAVRDAVRDAVDGAVGDAVRGAVGDKLVRFLLLCANAADRQEWFGWWWTGWCAWASFFRDVCELDIAEWDAFAAIEATQTRGGFPISLHADFAMVSDWPSVLRRDAGGRLHHDRGPAIAWRDGWSLYFWHGLRIPRSHEWIVETPGAITPDKIEAEPNAELRRVMLELFGFDRYFAVRNGRVVAEDQLHGFPRRLIELRVAREPIRVVEVTNGSLEPDGTRRKFHLGAMRGETPAEVIAASYGIAPKHYREAVRS